MSIQKIHDCAVAAVLRVGKRVNEELHRARELAVKYKGEVDLVTEIDVWSERELSRELYEAFPQAKVLGEEGAEFLLEECQGDLAALCASGDWWIIDPIDGTTNFVSGIPHVGISVALYRDGCPVLGVVNDPAKNELFSGIKGVGAWLNGQPISTSQKSNFRDCVIATGFPYDRAEKWPHYRTMFETFLMNSRDLRRFGAASLDLCWVACGRFDGYFEYGLKPWDAAAGTIIAAEAGANLLSAENPDQPYSVFFSQILCAAPGVFDEFVRLALEPKNLALI